MSGGPPGSPDILLQAAERFGYANGPRVTVGRIDLKEIEGSAVGALAVVRCLLAAIATLPSSLAHVLILPSVPYGAQQC